MPTTTRSMKAANILAAFVDDPIEHINHTRDPIQKTFVTQYQYLRFWRFVLYQRYVGQFKPNKLSGEWTDLGKCHAPYPTTPVTDTSPVHEDLQQSTIEVRELSTHRQILKIHVYYTTGKILIQGNACRQWVDEEFSNLMAVVHTLAASDTDPELLTLLDKQQPDADTAKAIMTTVEEYDMALVPTSPITKSRRSSSCSSPRTLQALVLNCGTTIIITPPPLSRQYYRNDSRRAEVDEASEISAHLSAFQSHDQHDDNEHAETMEQASYATISALLSSSPVQDQQHDNGQAGSVTQASGTAVSTPLAIPSSSDQLLSPSDQRSSPSAQHSEEDQRAGKADIVALPSTDISAHLSALRSLDQHDNGRAGIMEHVSDAATSTSLSLPPCQDQLHEGGQVQNNVVEQLSDAAVSKSSAQPSHNTVGVQTELICERCNDDYVSADEFHRVTEDLRNEIAALRSTLREARDYFKIEISDLETLVRHARNPSPSPTMTQQSSRSSYKKAKPDPARSTLKPSSQHSFLPSETEDAAVKAVPATVSMPPVGHTSTAFKVADDSTFTTTPVDTTPKAGISADPSVVSSSSANRAEFREASIEDDWPQLTGLRPSTRTLILGDSVVSGLHERKMYVDSEPTQVLALSGLDRASLLQTLKGTAPQPGVTTLVLHVGINDCKRGHVLGTTTWRSVLSACRRCFPKARILLSSILPHRDDHAHIDFCISESNLRMDQICKQSAMAGFIDNDAAFFTRNGEVKTGWMRDAIHPNIRGSSGLAVSIKKSYSRGTGYGQTYQPFRMASRPFNQQGLGHAPNQTSHLQKFPQDGPLINPQRNNTSIRGTATTSGGSVPATDRFRATYSTVAKGGAYQQGRSFPNGSFPGQAPRYVPDAHQTSQVKCRQQEDAPLDLTRQQPVPLTDQEQKIMLAFMSRYMLSSVT